MITRGGKDEERLYLYSAKFKYNNEDVLIERTDMDNIIETIVRHKARYYLPAFFCRANYRILDFPCGSGYGSEILAPLHVDYEGQDCDSITIQYCKQVFGDSHTQFTYGDLTHPVLESNRYNVIACIEGLEHIEQKYQAPLISAFYHALKPQGVLVVSSPQHPLNISGPSPTNMYHKHELSFADFSNLLRGIFGKVQIITQRDTLHNGLLANCLYGICRKESE